MTGGTHITDEDLALYAMQDLSVEERGAIETHVASCALCTSGLAEISGDLALLALSTEALPLPLNARQRFLDAMAANPVSQTVPAQKELSDQRDRSIAVMQDPQARTRTRKAVWIPWAVAAGLAIATVTLGVQNFDLNNDLHDEARLVSGLAAKASHAQQVLEVLTSPYAKHVTLVPGKSPEIPTGRATYLPDHGGLIFVASHLKPLPAGQTYELWIIPASGKAPVPAGTFHPDELGTASLIMPPLPSGIAAKAFGVTMEKDGGSTTPTMPILLAGGVPGV